MTISEQLQSHGLVQNVIEDLITLNNITAKRNGYITINSPLRKDDTKPSFSIDPNTGAWKDFGGNGASGDIVDLYTHLASGVTNNTEAINEIKERYLNGYGYNGNLQLQSKTPKDTPPFWDNEKIQLLKKGMGKLKESNSVVKAALDYDMLTLETLRQYKVGIIKQWNKEWLALPYRTGCQLYRRENGNKNVCHFSGSKPTQSFFGLKMTSGKDSLLIAKSPRECMLLWQQIGHGADAIGLVTGEQGNISDKQKEALRSQISEHGYKDISILLDCDTEEAIETSRSLALAVSSVTKTPVNLVNIHKETNGQCKDVTDAVKSGYDIRPLLQKVEVIEPERQQRQLRQCDKSIQDELDVKTAPPIPGEVYENLPETLQSCCSLIEEGHQKDVFLIASLPVISGHMSNVNATHYDGFYSPHLFAIIVAKPGTGKGIATKAKRLGYALNEHLVEISESKKQRYEALPSEEKAIQPAPRDQSLYIPANSSSRAIYDIMEANGGTGLLFENEIDTMLNATKQDWGDFSDVCRKAFHHESLSINRKDEHFNIDKPKLAMCLTGTFGQFKAMFQSAENGHFSRYGMFTFDAPVKWQSHRPTHNSMQLGESVEKVSQRLLELYNRLNARENPLYIELTSRQWDAIDETFAEKMDIIESLDLSPHLHASNNRMAIIALRTISAFTVLRAFDNDSNQIDTAASLIPTEEDMAAGLWLADTMIKHAIRLYYLLPNSEATDKKGENYYIFIQNLSEKFKTGKAVEIGRDLGVSEKTVKNWLKIMLNDGTITKIKHGVYIKGNIA